MEWTFSIWFTWKQIDSGITPTCSTNIRTYAMYTLLNNMLLSQCYQTATRCTLSLIRYMVQTFSSIRLMLIVYFLTIVYMITMEHTRWKSFVSKLDEKNRSTISKLQLHMLQFNIYKNFTCCIVVVFYFVGKRLYNLIK